MVVNYQSVFPVVVAEEIVLSLFASLLNTGATTEAEQDKDEQNQENNEQNEILFVFFMTNDLLLSLQAGGISILSLNSLLDIIWLPCLNLDKLEVIRVKTILMFDNEFLNRGSIFIVPLEVIAYGDICHSWLNFQSNLRF